MGCVCVCPVPMGQAAESSQGGEQPAGVSAGLLVLKLRVDGFGVGPE